MNKINSQTHNPDVVMAKEHKKPTKSFKRPKVEQFKKKQINNLTLQLKELEEKQTQSKRKEIVKIRVETNKTEKF